LPFCFVPVIYTCSGRLYQDVKSANLENILSVREWTKKLGWENGESSFSY
jgi:hypothetical protein